MFNGNQLQNFVRKTSDKFFGNDIETDSFCIDMETQIY